MGGSVSGGGSLFGVRHDFPVVCGTSAGACPSRLVFRACHDPVWDRDWLAVDPGPLHFSRAVLAENVGPGTGADRQDRFVPDCLVGHGEDRIVGCDGCRDASALVFARCELEAVCPCGNGWRARQIHLAELGRNFAADRRDWLGYRGPPRVLLHRWLRSSDLTRLDNHSFERDPRTTVGGFLHLTDYAGIVDEPVDCASYL